jgi:hypothetical protein
VLGWHVESSFWLEALKVALLAKGKRLSGLLISELLVSFLLIILSFLGFTIMITVMIAVSEVGFTAFSNIVISIFVSKSTTTTRLEVHHIQEHRVITVLNKLLQVCA